MNFVWTKGGFEKNAEVIFSLELTKPCDTLTLYAADSFRVFLDGGFVCYGPERTAAGYARKRAVDVSGARLVEVYVLSAGVPTYEWDLQSPFFGAELSASGSKVYGTEDFSAFKRNERLVNMPRYSGQRGFAEGFDLTKEGREKLETVRVDAPKLLLGLGDSCDYLEYGFHPTEARSFNGFDDVVIPPLYRNPLALPSVNDISVEVLLFRLIKNRAIEYGFCLESEKSGFISIEFEASEECEALVVFDEIMPDGKWIFRRSGCNDIVYARLPKGKSSLLTSEPYTMKLMKVISSAEVSVKPKLIGYENNRAECLKVSGNEEVVKVIEAAKNTFMQNSVDIFTDCPGRERAGWLCDSYFTALAEQLFTGKNPIEEKHLENIILADLEELPKGMLPMCFPAQHPTGRYIPNWAMWFIVELRAYLERSGRRELVDAAKDKVYGIISFFDRFVNSDGLLEDLESWIFIEWSVANDESYVKGVNYPSNMIFAKALEDAGALYADTALTERAEKMRREIRKQSYNGSFFVDNATRKDGKLLRRDDHISETCQYYALFTGIECDGDFTERMIKDFGPLRKKDVYAEVGKSNMFVGNYLRFLWLNEIGEEERVVNECLSYFRSMTEVTGTLWEHDSPRASCNHGFASSIAAILLRSLIGYAGVKDGKPILKENFKHTGSISVKAEFNY